MKNKISLRKVLTIFVLMISGNLFSLTLPITVYDRELDLPLEGVRVTEIETGVEIYTDFNGEGILELPELDRAILLVELIGYETKKQLVTDFESPLDIYMLMEGVLEGEELVVEVEAIGVTDAEVGVSTVVEEEVIQAAAKIGFIEDAMSAVKILPGVTYSGGMASNLSIRGSDSNGFSAVMDGMTIGFPYHFGGMVSIFNPNVVESIKFSPGIFSVKYGEATSALLEVNTVTPDDGFKFNILASSSTSEAFFQIPMLDNKAGVLAGLRLSYWEPALRLMSSIGEATDNDELKLISTTFADYPYIYDFYFKGYYKPSDSFNWYLNVFSGNDGVGFQVPELPGTDIKKEVLPYGEFLYANNDLILSTGLNIMPKEDLLINLMLGQEIWLMNLDAVGGIEGTQIFTQQDIDDLNLPIDRIYIDQDLYDVDMTQTIYNTQGRFDVDWSLADNLLLQSGFGTTFSTMTFSSKGFQMNFQNLENVDTRTLMKYEFDYEGDGDKRYASFAYTNASWDITNKLSLEAGVRLDHFYADMDDEDIEDVNTPLVPAPRARFTYKPGIGNDIFSNNSFSLGVGLFNNAPWNTGNFDIPEKSLMSVVGWDTHLPEDFHFKIEGYYKYIYDRSYVNTPKFYDAGLPDITHSDGFGHIAGGDFLLERKISRYIDGMLSYTYVWARYQDPTLEDNYKIDEDREAPRGEYYWPDFHRFHSLNLLFNIKPSNSFTITTKFSLASGLPKRTFKQERVQQEGMLLNDNTNIYSDSNRADIEMPLDIKFVWHNYYPESKYNWEFYIGFENVLAPLLVNMETSAAEQGELLRDKSDNQDGSFNAPIPSIGFRVSF